MNNAKEYKYLIFDFDGTINDTSQGIYATFKAVLDSFEVDYSHVDFFEHIGPPLDFSYNKLVGSQLCREAIKRHYRFYKELHADRLCRIYDGIDFVIESLHEAGYVIALASSKYEPHLVSLLQNLKLDQFFTCIYGQTEKRGYKVEILRQLIEDNRWEKEQCIMIGDTLYDVEGAHGNGIDVLAVAYGFGKKEDLIAAHPVAVVDTPQDVLKFFA